MRAFESIRRSFAWGVGLVVASAVGAGPALGQTKPNEPAPAASAERDGQHDFDPLLGSWKYHLKRRLNPLTGSNQWIEFEGTGECYKVWDGRAELDTIKVDGPSGHVEGLTLRTYNTQTHQWSLFWANAKDGNVQLPQIGSFNKDGKGEFYGTDTLNGKLIFVRFEWTRLNTSTPHFEQAFSGDGGRTWEVNWITDQTHVAPAAGKSH